MATASSNLIRTSVPNLIAGVSQQADTFKLASQADEQVNAISSVVNGLIKRPSTEWVSNLNFSGLVPIKYFWINRSATEQYIGVLLNNSSTQAKSMKIYDLAGAEQTFYEYETGVTLTNYFSGVTEDTFKTLTIADYSFLVNSNKVIANLGTLTTGPVAGSTNVYQGMIVVKQGYSGRSTQSPSGLVTYSIKIVNKTTGDTYATSTSNSDNFANTSPSAIATSIVANMSVVAGSAFATGSYRILAEGSNVYIQHESVDFDLVVDDGYAGTLFYGVKDSIQNFTDLPTISSHLFNTKVAGLPSSTGDEYYVRHISEQATNYSSGSAGTTPKGIKGISDGYWEESVAVGVTYLLNPATMPHALVKIASNKFLFTPLNGDTTKSYGGTAYTSAPSWGSRTCGDVESNPWPSFLGKTINNLFFFKNRLGILSGESVILSEAGEFFNFFRTTMTQLLDSDPIDISSSTSEVGTLYHALPFYDRVVLFAEKLQFSLQSDGELTVKSVSLQQTTAFDVNTKATPIAIGNKIYFTFTRNVDYTGVNEYFINPNTVLLDGLDISSNIPTYITGTAKQLVGSETDNILLVLKNSVQNEVAVYKFFYSGEEKIQSAWSKFDFGTGAVVNFASIANGKIYFVITRGSIVSYEVLNLDENKLTANSGGALSSSYAGVTAGTTFDPFRICLDKLNTLGGLTEQGSITDQGDYHATSTSVNYRIYTLPTGYSFSTAPSWSSGTKNSSSGYFKNPATELVISRDGISYQGFRVYRNASTGVLNFSATGVVSNTEIMIKTTKTILFNSIIVPLFTKASTPLFFIGLPYNMTYSLSRPIIRSTAGRGQSAVLDGRLQIRNGIVNYFNTRFFQIKVTPKYKDTYTYTYLYKVITDYLGVGPTNLDYINFDEGSYKFPVFTNAEEMQVILENSSPYSCSLLSLEWEALYSARSKRIG